MEQEKDSSRTEGRADWLGGEVDGTYNLWLSPKEHCVNCGPCLPSSPLCIPSQIVTFCWERGEC